MRFKMGTMSLFSLFIIVGCHSIEPLASVDTNRAHQLYNQLDTNYPKLTPRPERSTQEIAYDCVRYPLLYTGTLAYMAAVVPFEEAPLLVGGISGTTYGDQWIDWWEDGRRQDWEVWVERTNLEKQ